MSAFVDAHMCVYGTSWQLFLSVSCSLKDAHFHSHTPAHTPPFAWCRNMRGSRRPDQQTQLEGWTQLKGRGWNGSMVGQYGPHHGR